MSAVLDDDGKAALQKYLNLGGNFVAIHSASDCLRNTTFYGQEVGQSEPASSWDHKVFMVISFKERFLTTTPRSRIQ